MEAECLQYQENLSCKGVSDMYNRYNIQDRQTD